MNNDSTSGPSSPPPSPSGSLSATLRELSSALLILERQLSDFDYAFLPKIDILEKRVDLLEESLVVSTACGIARSKFDEEEEEGLHGQGWERVRKQGQDPILTNQAVPVEVGMSVDRNRTQLVESTTTTTAVTTPIRRRGCARRVLPLHARVPLPHVDLHAGNEVIPHPPHQRGQEQNDHSHAGQDQNQVGNQTEPEEEADYSHPPPSLSNSIVSCRVGSEISSSIRRRERVRIKREKEIDREAEKEERGLTMTRTGTATGSATGPLRGGYPRVMSTREIQLRHSPTEVVDRQRWGAFAEKVGRLGYMKEEDREQLAMYKSDS